MIIEIDGKRVRRAGWEVWKQRGKRKLYLMLLINSTTYPDAPPQHGGWWNIPVEHGGNLAMTGPSFVGCYNVSWRKLDALFRADVVEAITKVESAGTPHSRDEHIYAA